METFNKHGLKGLPFLHKIDREFAIFVTNTIRFNTKMSNIKQHKKHKNFEVTRHVSSRRESFSPFFFPLVLLETLHRNSSWHCKRN